MTVLSEDAENNAHGDSSVREAKTETNVTTPHDNDQEESSKEESSKEIENGDQIGTTEPIEKEIEAASVPQAGRTKIQNAVIMGALCIALFLSALDITIISTIMPTIVSEFDAPIGYVWIGSAYLLGNAAVVPVWGKVSDIFGRKQTLLVAVGVFLLGSLLCGVSRSMGMLIAARVIQGIGGGGAVVLPNICISDLFSPKERGLYFSILSVVWALASALGPLIGGIFTTRVSWRWCFFINLPIGGLALLILIFFLKLHNPRTPFKAGLAAIDWIGNLLIIGGTLMVLMGLVFGGVQFPWGSATVICLIVFGFVTVALFITYEAKFANYPVIPMRVFKYRNSISAYSLSITHSMVFLGGSYWLPLYFQAVLGADSLMSGVYLLPYVISSSLLAVASGLFIKKTGNFRWPIILGLLVMTIGFGLLTYLGAEPHWDRIIIFQIIAGLGSGTNFQAPLIALQTNIKPQDIGAATSAYSLARQIGTSVSVVLGGAVFNNVMNGQQGFLASVLGPKTALGFDGSHAAASVQRIVTFPTDRRAAIRSAYWDALQKMFILYTCVIFIGLLISSFIKQSKLSDEHIEHKTGLQSFQKEHRGKSKTEDGSQKV